MRRMVSIIIICMLCGCNYAQRTKNTNGIFDNQSDLVAISYAVTDTLVANLMQPIDDDSSILVSSFVDINYIEQSSALGRMMAEQVGSRFAQLGFKITELKLRESLYVQKQGGEFFLSRTVKDLSRSHKAHAVVVGTYTRADDVVYVSARIVDASHGNVISCYDFSIPITERILYLLRTYP